MAIIRVKHLDMETKFKVPEGADTLNTLEWAEADGRTSESGWQSRYEYEANIICNIINDNPPKTILEVGSGTGVLSQLIQNNITFKVEYHLVDKPYAKIAFEKNGNIGKFFVKNISYGFDTDELLPAYDMIICNDTLEHLFNPSDVVQKFYTLLNKNGICFISVPNWRMGHQFIYRGIFDYDNFLFFMMVHKFIPNSIQPSPLITPDYPKLNSEDEMPEELRRSWNWYFTFNPDK